MTPTARTSCTPDEWLTALAAAPAAALIWCDPPPAGSHSPYRPKINRTNWRGRINLPDLASGDFIAEQLRSMPHRWAVIYTGDHFSALHVQQYIRHGRRGFRYAGHYAAVIRVVADGPLAGATDLYARYVGRHGVWNDTLIY